jgi:hypothetical protein
MAAMFRRRRRLSSKRLETPRPKSRALRIEFLEPRQLLATTARWVGPFGTDTRFLEPAYWDIAAVPLNEFNPPSSSHYAVVFDAPGAQVRRSRTTLNQGPSDSAAVTPFPSATEM